MDQSRRDTINEWSSAEDRICPIPYPNNYEILKDLSRCFTSNDNPTGTSKSNIQFQRDQRVVIKELQATEWSQVHLVPKPTPEGAPQKWRFTLDYVRLNSATGALEGWPIPNIQQIINRIGTLKPKVFGIIDFTAGYHQTKLHPNSQEYTAFITQYGLFE